MNEATTPPCIALLTDFGDRGGYVGMLHGVIGRLCPQARVIDLTHTVTPQAVAEGAFLLHNALPYFPPDTKFVAVVDPGVGTARRPLCLAVPGVGHLIGPDNGLFSAVLAAHPTTEARIIANPDFSTRRFGQGISRTFHGRDIFAPTAALLASGEPFAAVGPGIATADLVRLPHFWPTWRLVDQGHDQVSGEVLHIDTFGNLITNIRRDTFSDDIETHPDIFIRSPLGTITGFQTTYGNQPPGTLIALFGSFNTLEIARVNGRADRPPQGDPVGLGMWVEVANW